jgi:hypothetical protein
VLVFTSAQPKIFIVLTGAYGNVGDGVIRRRVLDWVRDLGEVHAYVGNASSDWLEQLVLPEGTRIYPASRRVDWIVRLAANARNGALVLDPGEVPLAKRDWKPELLFLGIVLWLRLWGGVIIRPPRGIGRRDSFVVKVHKLSCRLSQVVMWRNSESRALMGLGEVTPDVAFAEPVTAGLDWEERDILTVSMRGKLPFPTKAWCDLVRGFAKNEGLRVNVVSQVREDECRSREICDALGPGAAYEAWGERSDIEQESALKDLYERSKYVLSDRLHVLILAAKAGAVVVEVADNPRPKIRETFEAVGIEDKSYRVTPTLEDGHFQKYMDVNAERLTADQEQMGRAALEMERCRRSVVQLVGRGTR